MARKRKPRPKATISDYGLDPDRVVSGWNSLAKTGGKSGGLRLEGSEITSGTNMQTVTGQNRVPVGGTLPKPVTGTDSTTVGIASSRAENFLTPDQQAQVDANLNDQSLIDRVGNIAGSVKDAGGSFLSSLFNSEDTVSETEGWKGGDLKVGPVGLGGVESVWDGFFHYLGWGYDRLNHLETAALSALPGGVRTLTWDESFNTNPGEVIVANAGVSMGNVRRGEAGIGDALALSVFGGFLPAAGAALAAQADPNTAVQRKGWDITSAKDREVFQSGWEKFATMPTNLAANIFTPDLALGYVTKLSRIRYLDRVIETPEQIARGTKEGMDGLDIAVRNLEELHGVDAVRTGAVTIEKDLPVELADSLNMSPIARFALKAVQVGPDGQKVQTLGQLRQNRVIRRASNNDALSAALYNAKDYNEAMLIIRHGWGDLSATAELAQFRPGAMAALRDGEQRLLSTQIAMNPASREKVIQQHVEHAKQLQTELDTLVKKGATPEQVAYLRERIRIAEDSADYARDFTLPPTGAGPNPTPAEVDLVKNEVKELREQNELFRKSLEDANGGYSSIFGSLRGSTAGFSADNALGRITAASRERRAAAAWESESTRGVHWWNVDEFHGVSKGRRLTRVWRYMGQETPAGIVHIAGIGAQESTREVRAMLNSVKLYSGKPKTVQVAHQVPQVDEAGKVMKDADGATIMRTEMRDTEIGGVARKEELITRYQNALLEGGVEGQQKAKVALDAIQEQIQIDVARAHGLDEEAISKVVGTMSAHQIEVEKSIKERGYWVDKDGTKNMVPFLESQLQGATFTKNWREIERAAERGSREGLAKLRGDTAEMLAARAEAYNSVFQDLWRPGVLLRLGYTQRNVAEGLFRSSAFTFSLAPLGLAGQNLAYAARNTLVKRSRQGAIEAATVAARTGRKMPKKYEKWHKAQVKAADDQIALNESGIKLIRDEIEDSPWVRKQEYDRIDAEARAIQNNNAALRTADDQDVVAKMEANSETLSVLYGEMARLKAMGLEVVDEVDPLTASLYDQLRYFEDVIDPLTRAQRDSLDDATTSAVLFRQQSLAKRRVFDGADTGADPQSVAAIFRHFTEQEAFDQGSGYASLALANLSADNTMKATAALRMEAIQSSLMRRVQREYVAVNPGTKEYEDGVATVLHQFQQSSVGSQIIQGIASGKPDDEIIDGLTTFLRGTEEGREIAWFVTGASKAHAGSTVPTFTTRAERAAEANAESAAPSLAKMDEAKAALDNAKRIRREARADRRARQSEIRKADKAKKPTPVAGLRADGKTFRDNETLDKWVAKEQRVGRAATERAAKVVASREARLEKAKAKRMALPVKERHTTTAEIKTLETELKEARKAHMTAEEAEKYRSEAAEALAQKAHADRVERQAAADAKLEASKGATVTDLRHPDRKTPWKSDDELEAWVAKHEEAYLKARGKYDEAIQYEVPTFSSMGKPSNVVYTVVEPEDAAAYAADMIRRYRQVTANHEGLQRYLATGVLPIGGKNTPDAAGNIVRDFFKDGGTYDLKPVIGNVAEELGSKTIMDHVRSASAWGFKVLGTIPEDALVRAPFYGKRYHQTYASLKASVDSQLAASGRVITMREVNAMRQAAHRRALKDTKDWLYTIDRRTVLGGKAGEALFPFISATQNSVTVVGRMLWNDPTVGVIMQKVWNAPNQMGLEDEEGRMHFSLPLDAVPEGVREFLGLDTMMDFTLTKEQLNVVLPQSAFDNIVPTPGPIVAIPVSEMMKHNWFGQSPVTPEWLASMLGEENATTVWEGWKSYVFGGSDQGASGMFLSADKALPPWMQKVSEMIRGEGSASSYTTYYNKIYQTEYASWAAGYRDEPPTPEEISEATNAFYRTRIMANLLAFSPPGYTSKIDPILRQIRRVKDQYPDDPNKADELLYKQFGSTLMQISRMSTTESSGGLMPSTQGVRIARNHEGLIARVAPGLEANQNLEVLGLLAENADSDYDQTAAAWQLNTKIPGTNTNWRNVKNPAESIVDGQKAAGWAQYLRNMDSINAVLNGRGLRSLQAKGAEDLRATKDSMVETMRKDPRYTAWYDDYLNYASTRTNDSIKLITAALSDEKWRESHMDSAVWQPGGIAETYMATREGVIAELEVRGQGSIDNQKNADLKQYWEEFRGQMEQASPQWAALSNRYLNGDGNPEQPSVIMTPEEERYAPEAATGGFIQPEPADAAPGTQGFIQAPTDDTTDYQF